MGKVTKLFDSEAGAWNAVNRITKVQQTQLKDEILRLIQEKYRSLVAVDLPDAFNEVIEELIEIETTIQDNIKDYYSRTGGTDNDDTKKG